MRQIALFLLLVLLPCAALAQTATVPCVGCDQTGAGGKSVVSSAYVVTSSVTINTTSDTSCFSGGFTVLPNAAVVGNRYRLRCAGTYNVPAPANIRSLTFKLNVGGASINNAIVPAPASSIDLSFWVDAECITRIIGASASTSCFGTISYLEGTVAAAPKVMVIGPSTATFDSTASFVIDITGTWDSTTGGPTASVTTGGIEVVN